MIKIIKPAILILLYFLFLPDSYGQGQGNMTGYLKQKFLGYSENVPREEIFIHTDRNAFIAGEDLWFNVYLIDRNGLKPALTSRIVYFEVLNPENRPVVQKRILIDNGFGPGQIVLPDTLSSGIYTIRAYTSWMKNFLPENCFRKDIKIYNSFSKKAFVGKVNAVYPSGKQISNLNERTIAGLKINVDNLKADIVEIFVITDERWRAQNGNLFYLFIQTHGIIDFVSPESLNEDNTKISISKKLLTAGINQITVFDSKGKPVSERYIYTPDKKEQILNLQSPDSSYVRNKISLDLNLAKEIASTVNMTNLSISVAPETDDAEDIDLNDYMVFGSEFGLFPWQFIKGRKLKELPTEVIDSLLLTLKSNWIDWETVLSGDLPLFKFKTENEDHYLFGKLLSDDQKPVGSGEYLLLSTPGKEATFQYSKTDEEGNFNFSIHIDHGLKDLIIQTDKVAKNQIIKFESSFSEKYLPIEKLIDSIVKPIPPYISQWSVNYQVRKIYESSSLGAPLAPAIPPIESKRFYGLPDERLIMADYIKLPVMQEVFFELVHGVFLKSKKSEFEISVSDPVSNKKYDVAPGMMIDGVIIKDPSLIGNMDPEIVEKIDVVWKRYFIGDYLFYGMVNIITKSADFSSVVLPGNVVRLPYKVIEPVASFSSPDYSVTAKINKRIPDFRNTLYWNPSVKADKEGKARIEFWTSDNISNYIINIQGFTFDGKAVSLRKIIKVK